MCFIRKPEYLLAPQECPIVSTHVATLKEDLRRLASAPERLAERGRRGREYVEKYFTVEAVSERLGRAYRELGVTP
jgi:glycosyltransferase involved in cell wall biosynthesis